MSQIESNPKPDDRPQKILEYAERVRQFEIGLFWTRSLFFWGFTTTAIASYGAAYQANRMGLAFAAACFGLICSCSWTLVNRSSKYWQSVWEKKVEKFQYDALGVDLFSSRSNPKVKQNWFWGPMHYSVSKLAIAFSDFTLFGWIGLAFWTTPPARHLPKDCALWFILAFTVVWGIAIFWRCQPDSPDQD